MQHSDPATAPADFSADSDQHAAGQRTSLGIVLMVLAMLIIPLVDAAAKYLSRDYSPLYVSWARYAVAAMLLLPLVWLRLRFSVMPRTGLGAHVMRTLFLLAAMTLYFVAISVTEMAVAASAYFCGPAIATLIAVRVFNEALTARKAIALLVGLAGVLLVVRPGWHWEVGSLLGLAAGAMFALYLVATRIASRQSDPVQTLVFQTLLGVVVLLPLAIWKGELPALVHWPFFLALGGFSVISHFLAITAFRYAQTSTLAPLVYVELLGVIAVGMIFFDEVPTPIVWAGASLIILAGLMTVRNGR